MLLSILFGSSYWALMPAWAREALDVQSDGLGILMTIMGAGALVGTLGLAAVSNMTHRGLVLLVTCLMWGLSLAAFSQVTNYLAAVPFLLVLGLVNSVFMSLNMTMMQVLAPPEMRGRMMAIGMMTFGAMPLSAMPFGALAEVTGSTPDALLISGVLLTVATLIFWAAHPTLRRLR
jgi:predicted MFS family arabinose efflux permease